MKRLIRIILFAFLPFSVIHCYAQQYQFINYSINEGLSQSVVNCIFQDSKGYIWIGTQNGLNRFDGETFTVLSYSPVDSNSMSNNWVYSITEDTHGNLWIGTKAGINEYLVNQKTFKRFTYKTKFPYDITQYSYDVIRLKNGALVINTPPVISVYDPEQNVFTHFRNKLAYDGAVKDVKIPVIEDNEENLWIGSTKGCSEFCFKTKTFTYFSFYNTNGALIVNANITALYQDKKGVLWAGTTTGLFKYNAALKRFDETRFTSPKDENFTFKNTCIRSIIEDKYGNLIIGTEGKGLYLLALYSKNPVFIQNFTAENSELSHDIVQSLMIDKSENLWIGTLQGISKTDLKKKTFKLYRNNNTPNSLNLSGNVIASLYKEPDGTLWVGTWGQGLNRINRNTNVVEQYSTQLKGNHYISNDFIHVIFKDSDNHLWLGTRNGIIIYDKWRNMFVPYYKYFKKPQWPKFENVRISMIIQDRSSNYWIGTQNGLYKINKGKSDVEVFKKEMSEDHQLSANLIYCLLEDKEGWIWIATVNGLDVYNPVSKEIKHFRKQEKGLCDNFIISLCEDRMGRIWIGTSTYVNVFNKKDSTFIYYSQEQGLPNNRIFEIIKDKKNNLWLATGKGLCRFDEKKNTFHTFTLEDGLQSLEFNLRAAYVCPDGEILIGGMNGFNSFFPDSIYKNPYLPNVVFTSFYITNGTSKEYINLEEKPEIVLHHNVNSFTIEFAALEFTNPGKNNYAYKMEGISDDWVYIGNRNFVPFTGLPPGDYVFNVKGSNNDEAWNNQEISIKITILPPWWKSIFAFSLYLVLIILAVIFYIRIRVRKLKRDKKILEKKVSERTQQINEQSQLIISKNLELNELNSTKDKFFTIIGHDLRNPFGNIMCMSEIMISKFTELGAEKTESYLKNIYNSSRQAYDLLENLLAWSRVQTNSMPFNPEIFDAIIKIKSELDFFGAAILKKQLNVNFPSNEEILIYADINMFSTIIRNLLSNAIKFTQTKGTITISIQKKENHHEITVKDNGLGMSEETSLKIFRIDSKHSTPGTNNEKGTGLGLILCKDFVEKHHGTIWVESMVGKGSTFFFTLPVKAP